MLYTNLIIMTSISSLKEIVHKLHLDDLAKSMNKCRKDTRGGFLIPTSAKVTDSEYARYRHLPTTGHYLQ